MNKQFKVGQVWKARGGWVYPPITQATESGMASADGRLWWNNDGMVFSAPCIHDLVELVQGSPEPKPKTRRPFTLADMPGLDVMMWIRLKDSDVFVEIVSNRSKSQGVNRIPWKTLMDDGWEYTIDGGETWLPFYVEE
jgi:hypothetical protein